MADEVLLAGAHADAPFAAPPLRPVGRDSRALDVAGVRHRDRRVLVGDQVFDPQLAAFLDNHRPAGVGVLVANFLQLVEHHLHQQFIAREDRTETLDGLEQLHELVDDLLPLEPGQALQLHVQYGLPLEL
jgi:hypothetical protein